MLWNNEEFAGLRRADSLSYLRDVLIFFYSSLADLNLWSTLVLDYWVLSSVLIAPIMFCDRFDLEGMFDKRFFSVDIALFASRLLREGCLTKAGLLVLIDRRENSGAFTPRTPTARCSGRYFSCLDSPMFC